MCGIVGVVTKGLHGFSGAEVDAFSELLYADQLRGVNGTGIFYNSKKAKAHIKILKAPWKSSDFVATPEFEEATKTLFQQSNFAIGHNRAATKGKINVECTHPFKEQHITLIHNGTLDSHKELHDDKEVEVDSHAICHSIANIGAKETLSKISGAFALVWFDGKERTLNLCRNWQRPLFIIECQTCHIIVSELELGLWIAKRNSLIVVKEIDVPTGKILSFPLEAMNKFTEEDVEFKKYEQPKQDYSKYAYNKKSFAFGELIRFKSGVVRIMPNGVVYLEGDINSFPYVAPEQVRDTDYEDEFRLKFFDKEYLLRSLAGGKDLQGRICGTTIKKGTTTYYVSNVTEYKHKVEGTTVVPFKKGKKICGCCQELYEEEGEWTHNMLCCPVCVKDLNKGVWGELTDNIFKC